MPATHLHTEAAMNPDTEGREEQGPNRIPYINDPDKHPHPKGEAPTEDDAAHAKEDPEAVDD